ncbi:methylglyoxal synthase [Phyllobacterium sp. 1468]|uniref:methylglyoxal synthase n=1 Tax=Phyllobacterium sp. 1468 TaxID=2817759 RepID=UPI002866286D|nr:methylglyoxal synthase [Phyllobacterium sp. 1468]MDR6631886.1 methylglyoxal synthase [Phyllobacterium sp. 1468]
MTQPFRLALIAHDQKKDDMVDFARTYERLLAPCAIVATGTTGGLVQDACPSLTIARVKSGPLGGDQQIGALIAEGKIDGLIFFVDPLSPMPHDVDVKALMRLASVYDIPMALNRATAEVLVQKRGLLRDDAAENTLTAPRAPSDTQRSQ